jgi:hypothetical protein
VEALAVHVLTAPVFKEVGVQETVGVEGARLLNVTVEVALEALVPPWPSDAVAVTLAEPGVESEYVVEAPVAAPVRPVADQL